MGEPINITTRQYIATTIDGDITTSDVYDNEFDAVHDLRRGGVDTSYAISIVEMHVARGRVQAVDVWQYGSIDRFFEYISEVEGNA